MDYYQSVKDISRLISAHGCKKSLNIISTTPKYKSAYDTICYLYNISRGDTIATPDHGCDTVTASMEAITGALNNAKSAGSVIWQARIVSERISASISSMAENFRTSIRAMNKYPDSTIAKHFGEIKNFLSHEMGIMDKNGEPLNPEAVNIRDAVTRQLSHMLLPAFPEIQHEVYSRKLYPEWKENSPPGIKPKNGNFQTNRAEQKMNFTPS